MALMSLGLFVFHLRSAPIDTISRSTEYRFAKSDPVGAQPRYQSVGEGADTLTLDGTLYPCVTGGPLNLKILRAMAVPGEAHLLMRGDGEVMGLWVITSITETDDHLMQDGRAEKIQFTLSLERTKSGDAVLGDFNRVIRQVVDTTITAVQGLIR